MSVDFKTSETKLNLMRAFAGESQARNRYTFAAELAKEQKLHVVEAVFTFTAHQERAHAKVFYDNLSELAGETIKIDGGYPVDITPSVLELLRCAEKNENEEHDTVYKSFGEKAKEEGFIKVASVFEMIAKVEKTHAQRFKALADFMEENKLFIADAECKWMCLNCGHIHSGKEAPLICPVCEHDRGFFIRLSLAPYSE